MYSYSSIDTAAFCKNCVLFYRSGLASQSVPTHAFASCMLMFFQVDETLLPSYVNLSTRFKGRPFSVEMLSLCLKHLYSVMSALTCRPVTSRSLNTI